MKKRSIDSMKKELIEIINSLSSEKLEKMIFVVGYIKRATPAEKDVLMKQVKQNGFSTDAWIETQKSLKGSATDQKEVAIYD